MKRFLLLLVLVPILAGVGYGFVGSPIDSGGGTTNASDLSTGTLPAARIGDNTVAATKIIDNTAALIGRFWTGAGDYLLADGTRGTPSGSGTVVGPATSTENNITTWGTDNVTLKDSGISIVNPAFTTINVTGANFTGTLQPSESVASVPVATGWVSWSVTEMVAWSYANNSPLYVATDGGSDGAANTNRRFSSMEAAAEFRPYLSVTYMQLTGGPGTPSISAPGKMGVSNFRGTMR